MRKLMIAVLALLLLPALPFAKTPQQCLDELTACTSTCCSDNGGTMVQQTDTTRCSAFPDQRDWQSTCLDPCLTPYNYCMMGATATSPGSTYGFCCGSGLIMLLIASGGLLLARRF